MTDTTDTAVHEPIGGVADAIEPSFERRRARGLTLWSVLALFLSPFPIPTLGMSAVIAAGLVVVALVLRWRGFDARRPLAVGIIALVLNAVSAGACSWLVLRTAEVGGSEAARQETIERDFDRVFEDATKAPSGREPPGRDDVRAQDDAGPGADADFSSRMRRLDDRRE